MERERLNGYVASLEQIMRNTHLDLREMMDQFQELCHRVTPERIVPMGVVTDIRQNYKEIQDQLTKIKGIHQLLQGKYSQYYRRDSLRDREIMELAFLAKSLYSKFEFVLQEIEAKRRLKGRGGPFGGDGQHIPLSWFQFKENQMVLLRNLQKLYELDYKTRSDPEWVQRRVVVRNGHRSISLFILSGEVPLMDQFQSQVRLREHDIKERFTKDQLRGALTHLREISPSEVEKVIRRFTDFSEFSKLKCLLFSIQSKKDLKKEILSTAENILQMMAGGEVRTLSL
jgi:hypothetical protein